MMGNVGKSVNYGITHIEVGRGHINFRPEHLFAVAEFAVGHTLKEVEIFLNTPVSVRAFLARLGESSSVLPDLVCAEIVNISLAVLDELDCTVVDEIKIVRSEKHVFPPETEPLDILLDCVDIFDVLTGRIGIVKTKIAYAVVLLRRAEIYAQSLGVTDMEIAVRLRRKSRLNAAFNAGSEILVDKIMYKI